MRGAFGGVKSYVAPYFSLFRGSCSLLVAACSLFPARCFTLFISFCLYQDAHSLNL